MGRGKAQRLARPIRDWRGLERRLVDLGYTLETGKGNRAKAKTADGGTIGSLHRSTSDHRALKNLISDLRRQGVPV